MKSDFEWHDAKAEASLQAHCVSFDLAKTVFKCPFAVERLDDREDYSEEQHNMSKTTTFGKTPKPPRSMTAEAIERAARADRDAQPLTETGLKQMKRTPQARIIRRALELTQEEFASRYHIPLGTLRDWEQGRAEPDQPTRAYLTLIARDPGHVNRTLNPKRN
jgi:putative transcriptional regulator